MLLLLAIHSALQPEKDFLTVKYNQQADCPDITDTMITGPTAVQAGTTGSTYSLPNTGTGSFSWIFTHSQGNVYTNFTGQGTNSITVSWPSAPDFFQVSFSSGEPGGGCVVNTSVTYVSVFDPNAGFVSGGGWIISPADSDYEFMQTGIRAHLSLVARYGKRKGEEGQVQGPPPSCCRPAPSPSGAPPMSPARCSSPATGSTTAGAAPPPNRRGRAGL